MTVDNKDWSDWAGAQADQSLCWAYRSSVMFVVSNSSSTVKRKKMNQKYNSCENHRLRENVQFYRIVWSKDTKLGFLQAVWPSVKPCYNKWDKTGVTVNLVSLPPRPCILSLGTLYPGVKCPTLVYLVPGDTLPRVKCTPTQNLSVISFS